MEEYTYITTCSTEQHFSVKHTNTPACGRVPYDQLNRDVALSKNKIFSLRRLLSPAMRMCEVTHVAFYVYINRMGVTVPFPLSLSLR